MGVTWRDPRNGVGYAAACARAALSIYGGDRSDVVVDAIEIAERYAAGEEISAKAASGAAAAAADAIATAYVAYAAVAASDAAYAAVYAVYAVTSDDAAVAASDAAYVAVYADGAYANAVQAGVDPLLLRRLEAEWWVRDLGGSDDAERVRAARVAFLAAGIEAAEKVLGAG